MSDSYEILVDTDVTLDDAPRVAKLVIAKLREHELIAGRLQSSCVLGGKGYRPGSGMKQNYRRVRGEVSYWEMEVCGVEPCVGRDLNYGALFEIHEGFVCPSCMNCIDSFQSNGFMDLVGTAIGNWVEEAGSTLVACPQCTKNADITVWQCIPPLGFGNLSFRFWNWPPLDSSNWKIDICSLVKSATGHNIERTYARI